MTIIPLLPKPKKKKEDEQPIQESNKEIPKVQPSQPTKLTPDQLRALNLGMTGGTEEDFLRAGGTSGFLQSIPRTLTPEELKLQQEIEAIPGQIQEIGQEENLPQEPTQLERLGAFSKNQNQLGLGSSISLMSNLSDKTAGRFATTVGAAGIAAAALLPLGGAIAGSLGTKAAATGAAATISSVNARSILSTNRMINGIFGIQLLGFVQDIPGKIGRSLSGVDSSQEALVNSANELNNIQTQLNLGADFNTIMPQLDLIEQNLMTLDKSLHNVGLMSEFFYEKDVLKQRKDGRELRKNILIMRQTILQAQFNQMRSR